MLLCMCVSSDALQRTSTIQAQSPRFELGENHTPHTSTHAHVNMLHVNRKSQPGISTVHATHTSLHHKIIPKSQSCQWHFSSNFTFTFPFPPHHHGPTAPNLSIDVRQSDRYQNNGHLPSGADISTSFIKCDVRRQPDKQQPDKHGWTGSPKTPFSSVCSRRLNAFHSRNRKASHQSSRTTVRTAARHQGSHTHARTQAS